MSAGHWQIEQQLLQLHDKPAALLVGVEVLAPNDERRADAQRLGADDVLGLRLLLSNHCRHAAAQDAGFLEGDLRQAWRPAFPHGRARSA